LPNSLDWKDGGWAADVRADSEVVHAAAVVERAFGELAAQRGDDGLLRFQAIRIGYFCVDAGGLAGGEGKGEGEGEGEGQAGVVLNQIVTLREDAGKSK